MADHKNLPHFDRSPYETVTDSFCKFPDGRIAHADILGGTQRIISADESNALIKEAVARNDVIYPPYRTDNGIHIDICNDRRSIEYALQESLKSGYMTEYKGQYRLTDAGLAYAKNLTKTNPKAAAFLERLVQGGKSMSGLN